LRKPLDALAAGLNPAAPGSAQGQSADLAAERREHVEMYQLLGDPLMRIQYPQEVQLEASTEVAAGGQLAVDVDTAVAGECVVDLEPVGGGTTDRSKLPRITQTIERGKSHIVLPVPWEAAGGYTLRVFVAGQTDFAAGATTVSVQRAVSEQVARRTDGAEPKSTRPPAR
jgi:hypothetical protein